MFVSLAIEHIFLPNEVYANKIVPHSELMIFIEYEDNGYHFIHYI